MRKTLNLNLLQKLRKSKRLHIKKKIKTPDPIGNMKKKMMTLNPIGNMKKMMTLNPIGNMKKKMKETMISMRKLM
jgi:hypothetical protein